MNIVLVSLDCVRPDYMSCYTENNRTPFLETAKDVGVVFKNCICQASHTTTSHASMFTALYPFNHRVRWVNESGVKGKMVQEVLKDNGYSTAGFIGGWTLTQGYFARGFDLYHTEYIKEDTTEGRHIYTPIDNLVDMAIDHLDGSASENNYIFIHSFDAHFTSRSDKEGKRKDRYMEEIRNQDAQLKRLHDRLAQGEFLLVVTADHGDKLVGEHGYPYVYNHKGEKVGIHFHETEIYDVQLRVPFVAFGSGVDKNTVEGLCRSTDIPATILGHIGLAFDEDKDGLDLSKSLSGGEAPAFPEFVYSESYHAQLVAENEYACEMKNKYEWGWTAIDNVVSLRSLHHKLICTANGKIEPAYFFDLEADPGENENLIDRPEFKEEIERYYNSLMELIKDDKQYRYEELKEETGKIKEALKSVNLKKKI